MNEALRFVEHVIKTIFRLLWQLVCWLYVKLWQEPKDIKGPLWTAAFWCFICCGLYLVDLLWLSRRQFVVPLLCLVFAWLLMHWKDKKPKKLGRPLPYRRRR